MKCQQFLVFSTFSVITLVGFATPNCSVSVLRSLNFGTYNPFSLSDDNSTARIRIKCRGSGTVSYEIMLS